jgi:hypothetical protein
MAIKIDLSDLIGKRGLINKVVEDKVLEVTQKVTLDAHRNLVLASPVDTGAFRGAWTAEVPTKAFESGAIENNTEYAVPLAHGHSPQAPAGWIEGCVLAAVKGG